MSSQLQTSRMLWLLSTIALCSACATTVSTAPGVQDGAPNAARLIISPWAYGTGNTNLVSVDDRPVVAPPIEPKETLKLILEAGDRKLTFVDRDTAKTSTVTFVADAKKTYLVESYRGNCTIQEDGARVLYFSRDMGVGIYEFTASGAHSLVAYPQIPESFARVSVGDDSDATSKVLHLSDRPLADAESALLQFLPDSSYILAIVGEDQADPVTHYDYQGEYLRGERPLPRLSNILGVQALLDYRAFVAERAIRFHPGEYKLLCFFQRGNLESHTVSTPTVVPFTATPGGRFVFKGDVDVKFFSQNTWKPTIEPMD